MFQQQRKSTSSFQIKSLKDLTRIMSATQILSEEKRVTLIQKIKELSSLEASRYESLCASLNNSLVNYCQNLPETSNSYYSQPGGLVDHALNRTEAALSLFQEFMIQDPPGVCSEEQKLWQYALHTAAILQGIGKLFVDYRVHLIDSNKHVLKQWNPLLDSLVATGVYYSYEFLKEPEIEFRCRLNLLLAKTLMPTSGFAWIASDPQVLAVWLALLNEDYRSAGTLGAILIRADAIAIQRYFVGKLIKGSASQGGRYGRSGTFSGGAELTVAEKEQVIGREFIKWLQQGLYESKIMINKAPLLMVPGGLLMAQEMFQWFVREHPEYKNWQAIQKGFLSLGLDHRTADGDIVFSNFAVVLPDMVGVNNPATGKHEKISAVELIHRAQYPNQLAKASAAAKSAGLQKLSSTGQWLVFESGEPSLGAGAKHRG